MSRSYRRHAVRIVIAAIWLLPACFFAVFALDLNPDGAPVPSGQRAVYAVLALAFAALAVRTFRIGVFTGPSGVVVRNVLRTTRLAWEEVAAFEWGQWRGPGGFACGVVRRSGGGQVTAFALNPPFEFRPGEDRRVPDMLAALNEELAEARGWGQAPPSGAPGDPHGLPAAAGRRCGAGVSNCGWVGGGAAGRGGRSRPRGQRRASAPPAGAVRP